MTTIRRYLDGFRIAAGLFWRFTRPPPRELEIVEELLAGTSPQATPDDDVLAPLLLPARLR